MIGVQAEALVDPLATFQPRNDFYDAAPGETLVFPSSGGSSPASTDRVLAQNRVVNITEIDVIRGEPNQISARIGPNIFGDDGVNITIAPDAPFGSYALTYILDGDAGDPSTGLIIVTVVDDRDIVITADDAVTLTNQLPIMLDLYSNDELGMTNQPLLSFINSGDLPPFGQPLALDSGALLLFGEGNSITYDPNGAFNDVPVGQTTTDSFTYTLEGQEGSPSTATVTITIPGIDAAFPLSGLTGTLTENSDVLRFDSAILFGDGAGAQTPFEVVVNGQTITEQTGFLGDYGILSINPDGVYSYIQLPGLIDGLRLQTGTDRRDVFDVQVRDPQGAVAADRLDFTALGDTDAPFLVIEPETPEAVVRGPSAFLDIAIDHARGQIYRTTIGSADLRRVDLDSNEEEIILQYPGGISSLALSSDAETLYISQAIPFGADPIGTPEEQRTGEGVIYALEIGTGITREIVFDIPDEASGISRIEVMPDGSLAAVLGTGSTALGSVIRVVPETGAVLNGADAFDGLDLTLSPDGLDGGISNIVTDDELVLFLGQDNLTRMLWLFDGSANAITAQVSLDELEQRFGVDSLNDLEIGAVSEASGMIALLASNKLLVLDTQFNLITDLTPLFSADLNGFAAPSQVTGFNFSPDGNLLYVMNGNINLVQAIDTATFQQQFAFQPLANVSSARSNTPEINLQVSPSDGTLYVTTGALTEIFRVENNQNIRILTIEETFDAAILSGFSGDGGDDLLFGLSGPDADNFDFLAVAGDPTQVVLSLNDLFQLSNPGDLDGDNRFEVDLVLQDDAGIGNTYRIFFDLQPVSAVQMTQAADVQAADPASISMGDVDIDALLAKAPPNFTPRTLVDNPPMHDAVLRSGIGFPNEDALLDSLIAVDFIPHEIATEDFSADNLVG